MRRRGSRAGSLTPAGRALIVLVGAALVASAAVCTEKRRTLVVGQVAVPISLDPHSTTSLNDFRILANVFEGLIRYSDATLKPGPALARDWKRGKDGVTYEFRLQEGVRFHDGTPFNAEAVRFNIERIIDPDHPFGSSSTFPLRDMLSSIRSVETEPGDQHTVRLLLHGPDATLLSNLAYTVGFMVSPTAVRKERAPVGTGPFRFVDRGTDDGEVVLERHDGYWNRSQAARVDRVVFRPIVNPGDRATALKTGEIDLGVDLPAEWVERFRKDPEFEVHERLGPHVWYLILNADPEGSSPLRDVRVRKAVNHAIDKHGLLQRLHGVAEIAAGPLSRASWAFDRELQPYPYEPDTARRLLEEAGYDGRTLTFYVAQDGSGMLSPVEMATAISADMARVGIDVEIQMFEWGEYLSRVNSGLGDVDMAEMAWMVNDPHTLFELTLRCDAQPEHGRFNSGYYCNERVDELLEEAERLGSRAQRAEKYRQVQRIVWEDAPWAFVASWRQNTVTGPKVVGGFRLQSSFFLRLHAVEVP